MLVNNPFGLKLTGGGFDSLHRSGIVRVHRWGEFRFGEFSNRVLDQKWGQAVTSG